MTKLPKAISKANMPMMIEMISKAVIRATSLCLHSEDQHIYKKDVSPHKKLKISSVQKKAFYSVRGRSRSPSTFGTFLAEKYI